MRYLKTLALALLLALTVGAKPAPMPPPQDSAVVLYYLLFNSLSSVCMGNPVCIACASCIASQATGHYPAGSTCGT